MSTLLARVTGAVLAVPEPRRGHSRTTGEAYEIGTVNVLVANQNVTVLQLPRKNDFGEFESLPSNLKGFEVGDRVDVLAEISVYAGNPQARIIGEWLPAHDTSDLVAALASV